MDEQVISKVPTLGKVVTKFTREMRMRKVRPLSYVYVSWLGKARMNTKLQEPPNRYRGKSGPRIDYISNFYKLDKY